MSAKTDWAAEEVGDFEREHVCRGEPADLARQLGRRLVAGNTHQQLGEHSGDRREHEPNEDDPIAFDLDPLHDAGVPRCGDTDPHQSERRVGKHEAAEPPGLGLEVLVNQRDRSRLNWLEGQLVDDDTLEGSLVPGPRLLCSGGEGQGVLADDEKSQSGQRSHPESDRRV